jgi:hypothetical protein
MDPELAQSADEADEADHADEADEADEADRADEADQADQADDDSSIATYLSRARKAARHLPRVRREWVMAQVGDRLADALEGSEASGRPMSAVLASFGDPRDVVLAVDGHVPGAEARWMEFVAVLLVLAGGVLWRPAWLIGVVLLWVSPRWRWPDKLLATLIWPGGLFAASLLMTQYAIPELLARGDLLGTGFASGQFPGIERGSLFVRSRGSFHYLVDSTLGHPPLRHLLVLLAASVPPALVAIWLLRRARRPEPPQLAIAPSHPAGTGPAGTGPP